MIQIENLRLTAGSFALRDIALSVREGEYFVVVGPTGSGKTLLLESIAGLARISSGCIKIGGRDVTQLEPRERGVGYVPQDYALFPHLTVAGNTAFGLRGRGLDEAAIRQRVEQCLSLVGMARLAARLPGGLSGGEKQRTALARALAIEPRALLLDEPVSALDEQTRDDICMQLKDIQRRSGATTVHVCHNFSEMMLVAGRAALLCDGRVVQCGTPHELMERPRNRFAAAFVQARNIFEGDARPDGQGGALLRLADNIELHLAAPASGRTACIVRPENIMLSAQRPLPLPPPARGEGNTNVPALNCFQGTITALADLGMMVQATVACDGMQLVVRLSRREHSAAGGALNERIWISFAPGDVRMVESE